MSIYFVTSTVQSKHYKNSNNTRAYPPNSNNTTPYANMPYGFPAFPQSTFPNEKPPTLFHPASPKTKAAKPANDVDAASMASTSTFASTVSLLKDSVKLKLHFKDGVSKKAVTASTVVKEQDGEKTTSSPKPKEHSAKARTAEAYMVMAMTK